MALAETAKLAVQLSLTGNFAKQIGTASKSLDKFGAKLDNTQSRAYRAGQQIGTGIKRGAVLAASGVGIITSQVILGLDSLVDLEKQTAQTEAVIKSTGAAAGITAADVRTLAEAFESVNATIGDEVIQNAENLLLGFTNVRKKAFKPALQAILDINTRLGRGPEGLAGIAQLVGRALQDPVKGLGRLERVIGPLDAKTKKRIGNLVKENRLYDAQALLLKEVEKRFGGAFAKEGGTTGAKVAKFKDAIEDLQRTLAAGLLPVVSNIADALSELFQDPAVQKGVADFGKELAAFLSPEKIKAGIGAIKDIFSTIAAVAGPAAAAVGAMVTAFSKLPPDLRNLLVGAFAVNKLTGGLVTNIAGGLIGALKNLVVPVMTVQAGTVTVAGAGVPGAGPAGAAGAAGKGAGLLTNIVKTAAAVVAIGVVAELADQIHEAIKPPSTATSDLSWPFGPKNTPTIKPDFLKDLLPANGLLGGTPTNPATGKPADHFGAADQQKKLAAIQLEVQRKGEQTAGKLDTVKTGLDNATSSQKTSANAIQNTTRSSVLTGAQIGASATFAASGAIVGAIWAARPVVNVTNVTKTISNTVRYGAVAGSQGTNSDSGGNTIGH